MTPHMRMGLDADASANSLEHLGQSPPVHGEDKSFSATGQVITERHSCWFAEEHDAFLVALAQHFDASVLEVNLLDPDADEFRSSARGSEGHLQQRPLAACLRGLDQRLDFLVGV